jgi:hypothetical protein
MSVKVHRSHDLADIHKLRMFVEYTSRVNVVLYHSRLYSKELLHFVTSRKREYTLRTAMFEWQSRPPFANQGRTDGKRRRLARAGRNSRRLNIDSSDPGC